VLLAPFFAHPIFKPPKLSDFRAAARKLVLQIAQMDADYGVLSAHPAPA